MAYLPLSVLIATSIVSPSVVYNPLYTLPNAPVAYYIAIHWIK